MKKQAKITERLILYFVLIGFVSISGVSVLTYVSSREALLERSFEQLNSIKLLKKQQTEKFFNDRLRDATLLGKAQDVSRLVGNLHTNGSFGLDENSYIYNYMLSSGYFEAMVFSDFKNFGVQLLGYSNLKPADSVQTILLSSMAKEIRHTHTPRVYDYASTSDGTHQLYITAPVQQAKDSCAGFIAMLISPKHINAIMLESISGAGFGMSGESYLVGTDSLMRSSSRFIPDAVMNTTVNTAAVQRAFTDGNGIMITADYRGVKVLSSFCRLDVEGLNWVLLSEIDLKEVMLPVKRLRNQLLLLSVVLVIAVFFAAWFLSLKISAPIIRIKDAALLVSKGEFPTVNDKSNNDEINELVETFNFMSVQLREKKTQLEQEQLKQLTAVFDGQEQERRRLSQELHDGLGQMLAGLKFKIESLESAHNTAINVELTQLRLAVTEAIEEVRNMSFNLMPAILSRFGLVKALSNLCNNMQEQTGISITFDANGEFDSTDTRLSNYMFRIVQEALSNAVKHGSPAEVSVQLLEFTDFYTMIIEDNGCGFNYDPLNPPAGNGLYNMKERTAVLNGKFIMQSAPESGTIIRVKIPKTLNDKT